MGHTTGHHRWVSYRVSKKGPKPQRGRFIILHPDEEALQQPRTLEKSDYFRLRYRERIVVEHRIGRLDWLAIMEALDEVGYNRVLSRELGHGIPDEQQGARDTVKCRYCPVPICT